VSAHRDKTFSETNPSFALLAKLSFSFTFHAVNANKQAVVEREAGPRKMACRHVFSLSIFPFLPSTPFLLAGNKMEEPSEQERGKRAKLNTHSNTRVDADAVVEGPPADQNQKANTTRTKKRQRPGPLPPKTLSVGYKVPLHPDICVSMLRDIIKFILYIRHQIPW
jgi:hypothetical protein